MYSAYVQCIVHMYNVHVDTVLTLMYGGLSVFCHNYGIIHVILYSYVCVCVCHRV